MTPKEKALELWEKYFQLNYDWDGVTKDQWAKDGALIAVNEIIKSNPINFDENENCIASNWWEQVKQEIEKL
jgi:hypothetical protein